MKVRPLIGSLLACSIMIESFTVSMKATKNSMENMKASKMYSEDIPPTEM